MRSRRRRSSSRSIRPQTSGSQWRRLPTRSNDGWSEQPWWFWLIIGAVSLLIAEWLGIGPTDWPARLSLHSVSDAMQL